MITTPGGSAPSALCFGTMQFGDGADEAASRDMYAACRESGVNFFDTAYVYADGLSEEYLGRFARAERDDLIIASKVAYADTASPRDIRAQFDISRTRLGMDMIDILYLHRFDPETPLEHSIEAMAELRNSGRIRYVGVSNYAAWQVMKARHVAQRFDLEISIVQPMYSLVKRQAEVEILPMSLSEGMAVAPYSPLGGGLLTGKYARGGTGRLSGNKRYATRYGVDWMHRAAAGLADLADELATPAATLAVAWVAANPAITAPIISARSVQQLVPSLAAADLTLTDQIRARIDALSRRPAPATDRLEEA